MKASARSSLLLFAVTGLCWFGCHRADDAEVKAANGSADTPNVTFKQGRGLQIAAPTLKALGVATAEAMERPLANRVKVTGQVFDPGPPALASVSVASSAVDTLVTRTPERAKFLRLDRGIEPGTHQVELIFALHGGDRAVGDFVDLTLSAPAANVLAVPQATVIDGSSGSFVYVVNGGSFLRTAVKTGASDAEWVEITDGLYAGDVVVTSGVQKLWQAELLLIKGGADRD